MNILASLAGLALAVQSQGTVPPPPVAIDTAEIMAHMRVLTADSMIVRATPSRELGRAARYIGEQLAGFGIWAAGNMPSPISRMTADTIPTGKWFWRYPLPGQVRLKDISSRLRFSRPITTTSDSIPPSQKEVAVTLAADVYLASEAVIGLRISNYNAVLAGPHTMATMARQDWSKYGILYVPPPGLDSAERYRLVTALAARSRGVIVFSEDDSAAFERHRQAEAQRAWSLRPAYLDDNPNNDNLAPFGIVYVRAEAVASQLAALGLDLSRLRRAAAPVVEEIRGLSTAVQLWAEEPHAGVRAALNVAARWPGSDSTLSNQHVAIIAPMERPASVAGLLALAKAFGSLPSRPRRSVLFVVASGGPEGFWGSKAFVRDWRHFAYGQRQIVGAITLGRLGRMVGDTVTIDGSQDLDFAVAPAWLAARHPELRLIVETGATVFQPTGNHVALTRDFLPALNVRSGPPSIPMDAVDHLERADAEQAARILQLVFYVAHNLAEGTERPWRWNAGSRRRWLLVP